jgi:dihydropteroate synthase
MDRVIPIIEALKSRSLQAAISIDTSKPEVMRQAVVAGAGLINDVRALQEPGSLESAAELDVPVCLMHMQGEPRCMQKDPQYGNVVEDIFRFFTSRIEDCLQAGIVRSRLLIDPGFGFGKTLKHNLSLLKHLQTFRKMELPLLVGVSRKSMIGAILEKEVNERLIGSIAAATIAIMNGADIIRVHDVAETVDAVKICNAVFDAE